MIGYDQLISIARAICQGSLRPTYCKDPETFHPHLWVIEAMKQAYEIGKSDGVAQATAGLQAFIAESCDRQVEAVSKAKAEIMEAIAPKVSQPASTGVKDLRTGATVYATSPAGWYGSGQIENHRQPAHRSDEYFVRFVGQGGADWYAAHDLDSKPRLVMPPTIALDPDRNYGQPPTTGRTSVPIPLNPPCQRCGKPREAKQIKLEDPLCHKCDQAVINEAVRNVTHDTRPPPTPMPGEPRGGKQNS